jgi:hypothetical protein
MVEMAGKSVVKKQIPFIFGIIIDSRHEPKFAPCLQLFVLLGSLLGK